MKSKRVIDKTVVTRAVIIKIQDDRDPDLIKAKHIKGYDDPEIIYNEKKDKGYKPDIVSFNKNEINIYEIELNEKMPFEKWLLFAEYAKKNNGNLFLIMPDYLKEPIKEKIREKEIPTKLIYFTTE